MEALVSIVLLFVGLGLLGSGTRCRGRHSGAGFSSMISVVGIVLLLGLCVRHAPDLSGACIRPVMLLALTISGVWLVVRPLLR